jgi:hypothetical protein
LMASTSMPSALMAQWSLPSLTSLATAVSSKCPLWTGLVR